MPSLKAWADSLGGITYPLLSDFYPHGLVAERYGVLRSDGTSERAIFVIDKSGVIRYIDVHDIDHQPDNEVLFQALAEVEPELAASLARQEPTAAAAAPSPEPDADVVLYCTPWCPDCRRAREFFKRHQIPFVEIDITRDREAAARVKSWANGYETTPTFKVRGQVLVGYHLGRLGEALGIDPYA